MFRVITWFGLWYRSESRRCLLSSFRVVLPKPGHSVRTTECQQLYERSMLILIRIVHVRDDFGALNPWVTERTEGGHEDTETNHAYRHLPCSVTSGLASVPSVSKGLALWLRRSRVRKCPG